MIHELCRCRRCKTVPRHMDQLDVLDTSVMTTQTYCTKCGYLYVWRVVMKPEERAILADERRIPAPRLARLRAMEGKTDAQH